MTLRLRGSTSGYAEINAPAVAGDNSLTLPTTTGTIRTTSPSGVDGDYTVATGATISGSTNTITGFTNGSERFRVSNDGTFRIGTDSSNVQIAANTGLDINDGAINLYTATSNADAAPFIISTDVGGTETEKLRVTAGGYVGIGTDDPSSELHVQNDSGNCGLRVISSATGVSYLNLGDTGDNNIGSIEYSNNDNYMLFKTADNEALRIDSSGQLLSSNYKSNGVLTIGYDANGNNVDNDYIAFVKGASTEYMRLDGSGRLLVGDTTNRGASGLQTKTVGTGIADGALGLISVSAAGGDAPNSPYTVNHSVYGSSCASGGTENIRTVANEEVSFIKIFYSWPSGSPQWKTGVISRNQGTSLTTTWFHESNSGHVFTLAMSGDTLTLSQSVGVTMNMVIAFETVDTTGLD